MDSQQQQQQQQQKQKVSEREKERKREIRALKFAIRFCFSFSCMLASSFLFSFLFGIAAVLLESTRPVAVPALCRIISSSVDIRSSRVCELGFGNYKARHVFYISEKSRFRCRHDYYWASIFEVEYKEYFSGQPYYATAEVPKEALPLGCRPNFGAAWLPKLKFKVNGTYTCSYMLGNQKADLNSDNLFNCQAKDPSRMEMIRRFFVLLMKESFFLENGYLRRSIIYIFAGVISGMLVAMCSAFLLKLVRITFSTIIQQAPAKTIQVSVFMLHLRRVCCLLAYLCVMTWLALEYSKLIGLKQLFLDYSFWRREVTR